MSSPRPADLPLSFRTPPGWPEPTDEWIASHQGWEPEPNWAPESAAPRPAGWVLWERNTPVWDRMTAPSRAALKQQLIVGIVVGVLGLLATIIGSMFGGWFIIFTGAMIFPLVLLVLYPFRLRRIDTDAMTRVVEAAEEQRRLNESFVQAPAAPVVAGAVAGSDTTDQTPVAPVSASAPNWDALVAGGNEDGSRVGLKTLSLRTRLIIGGAALLVVGAVFAVLIPSAMAGNERFIDYTERVASQEDVDAAGITFSEAGGWAWMVALDRECKVGSPEATVEFSSVADGDTEQTRTYPLESIVGDQLLTVEGENLPAYAVLSDVDCVG